MALHVKRRVYEIFYYGCMSPHSVSNLRILYPLSAVQDYINEKEAKVLLIEDIGKNELRYHIQYWE